MNQEVIQFINANPNLFFATVENNLPKVRPFQFMFADGEKIYFCTSRELCINRLVKKICFYIIYTLDNLIYVEIRGIPTRLF